VYTTRKSIPYALQGYGVTIVSTSSGILTGKEAREKGIGGEVVGMVW
jgi:small subunit ribosomal protein S8